MDVDRSTSRADEEEAGASAPAPSTGRPLALTLLRYLVPFGAMAYVAYQVSWGEVLASFARVPAWSLSAYGVACLLTTALSAWRWRLLFFACGLPDAPSWAHLHRWYWIGTFYNTYVPGGIGGDILRAVATQKAAGPFGLTTAMSLVVFERVLGALATAVLIAVATFVLAGGGELRAPITWAAAVALIVCLVVMAAHRMRVSALLPRRIVDALRRLPRVQSRAALACAFLVTFLSQLIAALAGHALIAGVNPQVRIVDSLVNVPLIGIVQYVPAAIGGAFVREAGFVALYRAVHVAPEDAFAAAVAMGALQYALGALGGLLQWLPGARSAS